MQSQPTRSDNRSMDDIDHCTEQCIDCARICLKSLYRHCLQAGGEHVARAHVQLMTDCVEICKTAANFMTRGSERHRQVCALCAEICRACATDCESMDGMEECAAACRRCEESCRSMAA